MMQTVWLKVRTSGFQVVMRSVWLLVLASIFIVGSARSLPAAEIDINRITTLVPKLSEREVKIVKDELASRLPSLFTSKADKKLAGELIGEISTFGEHLDEFLDGNYMGLGNTLAGRTAGWIEEKIKKRYPDPNSTVRLVTASVSKYPDLYKKLGQAALNPDRDEWKRVSREVMREFVQERTAEGINIWKDMARQLINPPETLSTIGIDPVDLYVQGVQDWTQFLRQTNNRYHGAVLDCFYGRYREAVAESGSHGARNELTSLGLRGYRCGDKIPQDSIPSQITNFIKRLSSGASTLGKFELNLDELVDLLEEYHELRNENSLARFGDWLKKRFNKNLAARKKRTRDALNGEQARRNAGEAKRRRAVVTKLAKALAGALDKVRENDETDPDDRKRDEARQAACVRIRLDINEVSTLISEGKLASAQSRLAGLPAVDCPDVRSRIEVEKISLAMIINQLIDKGQNALNDCKLKHEVRRQIEDLPSSPRRNELVSKWNSAYETEHKARALIREAIAFKESGFFEKATAKLRAALGVPPFCNSTVLKLNDAIRRIAESGTAKIEGMIRTCKFKKTRELIGNLLEGPQRADLVARWNTAYGTAKEARGLMKAAAALKDQGELGQAMSKLQEARNLNPCERIIAAIDSAIARIQEKITRDKASDATVALGTCKFKKSKELIGNLPEGPQRAKLVARWNEIYKTERKVRDLVKAARAQEEQGEFGRAVGKLHEAGNLSRCDGTISAIDKAVSRINSRIAKVKKPKPKPSPQECVRTNCASIEAWLKKNALQCNYHGMRLQSICPLDPECVRWTKACGERRKQLRECQARCR